MEIHFFHGDTSGNDEHWRLLLESTKMSSSDDSTSDFVAGAMVNLDIVDGDMTMYSRYGHWYLTMAVADFKNFFQNIDERDPSELWEFAKIGFEFMKPWIANQIEIDGEPQQVREILEEIVQDILSKGLRQQPALKPKGGVQSEGVWTADFDELIKVAKQVYPPENKMPLHLAHELDNRDLHTSWLWTRDREYVEVDPWELVEDAIVNAHMDPTAFNNLREAYGSQLGEQDDD